MTIDHAILGQVMSAYPEVSEPLLENVIFGINRSYATAKQRHDQVDFVRIRDDELERCDLYNLFDYKIYQSAVGKYYALRRAESPITKQRPGTVYGASRDEVLIAVTKKVRILFVALRYHGKLKYKDVDNGRRRFARDGVPTQVPSEAFQTAKRKALAILNSHRGF